MAGLGWAGLGWAGLGSAGLGMYRLVQGTLTEREGSVQLTFSIMVACFEKKMFSLSKAADLN